MTDLTAYELEPGVVMHVQSSVQGHVEPLARRATRGSTSEGSKTAELAEKSWNAQLEVVRRAAVGIVDKLSAAAAEADQIEVEFGIDLSASYGVVLVKGSGAANLKVNISWKPKAS